MIGDWRSWGEESGWRRMESLCELHFRASVALLVYSGSIS
jgi:hypothetical protein